MRYEQLRTCPDGAFRRFCGVHKATFEAMLEVLERDETEKVKPGRPSKLSLPDQLLLALSYWREYRILFHVAADYGLHESTASRIVTRVEDALIGSGRFALTPRETLLEEGPRIGVVALDAMESPIERPTKRAGNGATTAARRSATRTSPSSSSSSARV